MTTHHEAPTSNWEHSHGLNTGDTITTNTGDAYTITVNSNGSITLDNGDRLTQEGVRSGLVHGELERVSDGKSHELATF